VSLFSFLPYAALHTVPAGRALSTSPTAESHPGPGLGDTGLGTGCRFLLRWRLGMAFSCCLQGDSRERACATCVTGNTGPPRRHWPGCHMGLVAGSGPADVAGSGKNPALGFFAAFDSSEESDRCC